MVETLQTAHVLLLVAWLGIDVGVFAGSFVIRGRSLPGGARVELRRLMRGLDLAPRLSVVLTIPVGLGLADSVGVLSAPAWLLTAVTAVAAVWCGGILWAYRRVDPLGRPRTASPARRGTWFARADLVLRVSAIATFGATAAHSLLSGGGVWAEGYIAWKALLFATTIAAGLVIRSAARPFTPALRRVVLDGPSEGDLAVMDRSMHAVYPAVLYIWTTLVVITAIAIANP